MGKEREVGSFFHLDKFFFVHLPFVHLNSSIVSFSECVDHFVDCAHFARYCDRPSFFFIMKSYCPRTCRYGLFYCERQKLSLSFRHCTEKDVGKDDESERDQEMEGDDDEE